MTYISAAEAAKNWGVSARRVRMWCADGQISGSRFVGGIWKIPESATKPLDMRTKVGKANRVVKEHIAHFYDPDFLQRIPEAQITDDDRTLAEVQRLWLEGKLEDAYQSICSYCQECKDESYLFFGLHIRFNIASAMGKRTELVMLYQRMKSILATGKYPVTNAYMTITMRKHIIDISSVDIPSNAMPLLLYLGFNRSILENFQNHTPSKADWLELQCKLLESYGWDSISASVHAIMAAYYRMNYVPAQYELHKQKALDIILPRRFYQILAEHSYWIDWETYRFVDEQTQAEIQVLSEKYAENMLKGHFGKHLSRNDDDENSYLMLKIAFLMVAGATNKEICDKVNLSLYKVKQNISKLYDYSGTDNRKDFSAFLMDKIKEM